MRRAAVIYNPVSGSGRAADAASRAEGFLRDRGWSAQVHATRDRSGAAGIARDLDPDLDLVVVAGGDGSLREVIEGLGDGVRRTTLAIVPTGNANIIARELGIPLDASRAIGVLSEGSPVRMDLGRACWEDRSALFLAVVGVGWDALTVERLDRLRHGAFGRAWYRAWADSAYLACGLRAMARVRWPAFALTVDGTRLAADFYGAHFSNVRSYAKGMSVTLDAHFQSGKLHLQGRMRSSAWALACHLGYTALRRRAPGWLSQLHDADRMGFESGEPMPFQIDGDFKGRTRRLDAQIVPGAIRILAPADLEVIDRSSGSLLRVRADGPGENSIHTDICGE